MIGTMGAVIKVKSPILERRALLYLGAWARSSGFILSLGAVIGALRVDHRTAPRGGKGEVRILVNLSVQGPSRLIHGDIPADTISTFRPSLGSGWIGFLVTSLNLMPWGAGRQPYPLRL